MKKYKGFVYSNEDRLFVLEVMRERRENIKEKIINIGSFIFLLILILALGILIGSENF